MSAIRLPRKGFRYTPDLAYAIGLIATDGYISKDKRHISLTSTDKQLLNTFKACLNKKNKITTNPPGGLSKKKAFRVQFGDVVFYDWLVKIGLHPKKSLTLGKIIIENRHFPDFLRGHLDGDGSILTYIDNYNSYKNKGYVYQRVFIYFRSASKKHIEWLSGKIIELKNIRGSLTSEVSKSQIGGNAVYKIKFSTKDAKVILNWIYYKNNLPCLERKYLIAKPFLNIGRA